MQAKDYLYESITDYLNKSEYEWSNEFMDIYIYGNQNLLNYELRLIN